MVSPVSVLVGPPRKYIKIDTYRFSQFQQIVSTFLDVEYQKIAILFAFPCIIIVVLLVQVRIHFNTLSSQEIEQLGTFKLFKKKVLSDAAPRHTAVIL